MIQIRRLVSAFVLGLVGLAACASSPDGSNAHDLAGCWYFDRDDTARTLDLPWGVRLTDEPLTGWPTAAEDARVAVTLHGDGETTDTPFGYWRPVAADSVRIGHPGMGGLLLRLQLLDQRLDGVAIPVGDAGLGARPPRPVGLGLAQCPDGS